MPISSQSPAAKLVEAIDALLEAASGYLKEPFQNEAFAQLWELHARVVAQAAEAGLLPPPPFEESGLPVWGEPHLVGSTKLYPPVRDFEPESWHSWKTKLLELLAAAKATARPVVPPCPSCGSAPAADDVDDVCPMCEAYHFRSRVVRHVLLDPDEKIIVHRTGQPYWERIPPSQIAKAARSRQGGSGRLVLDSETQTIRLDGTSCKIADPKAFAVYKEIVDACPQPLTMATLQDRVPGCRGDKKIRQLLDSLPQPLCDTVLSGSNGFWLNLSPPPARRQQRRGKKGRT